jgi:hypothetical protein
MIQPNIDDCTLSKQKADWFLRNDFACTRFFAIPHFLRSLSKAHVVFHTATFDPVIGHPLSGNYVRKLVNRDSAGIALNLYFKTGHSQSIIHNP